MLMLKNIKYGYVIICVISIIIIILSSLQYNIFEGFNKDIYDGVTNLDFEDGEYPMKDCKKMHDNYLNNGEEYIKTEKQINKLKSTIDENNKIPYNIQIQTHQTNNQKIAKKMKTITNSIKAMKYNCFNVNDFP